jgi:hypothetical protein
MRPAITGKKGRCGGIDENDEDGEVMKTSVTYLAEKLPGRVFGRILA